MMRILLLILTLLLPSWAQAAMDTTDFAQLPILHEGRIKPLDSFSRWQLQAIYGAPALPERTATAWLADVVFRPATAIEEKIFIVHDRDALHLLHLPERQPQLYSFSEVAAGLLAQQSLIAGWLNQDKKSLSAPERDVLRLYRAADDFRQLSGSLALLLPISLDLPGAVRTQLGVAADAPVTYLELLKLKSSVMQNLTMTLEQKHEDLDSYTAAEQDNAKLAYQFKLIESVGANNGLFRVIPPLWEGQEEWLSPWALVQQGYGAPAGLVLFQDWRDAATAWRRGDNAAWLQATAQLRTATIVRTTSRKTAFALELALNAYNPLRVALWLEVAGLVMLALGRWRGGVFWSRFAYVLLLAGLAAQGLCILGRMFILQRPPVSTLYESTLFVSFVALAVGLFLAWRRRYADGAILGGVIAVLLLLSSNVFGADGDTLKVLTAVLDTNFWLATHVVCITTGYGATLLTGMMAHLYLLRTALGTPPAAMAKAVARIHSMTLFALLFTAVGTMLGGIWADQSWGRFWGWDPKENGALWIVLWLIWLLHGRMAGQLSLLGQMIGTALVNIVVALAWFGVNLLSVGLHSYGFTDAAAYGLGIFSGGELLLIGALGAYSFIRQRTVQS